MRKKNKLYTVNKYNRHGFTFQGLEDNSQNQYSFGGEFKKALGNIEFGGWDGLGKALGEGVGRIFGVKPENDYGFNADAYIGASKEDPKSYEEQMQEKANATASVGQYAEGGVLGGLSGGISSIGSAVGGAVGSLIGNGYESGVGNVVGSIGKMASVIPGPWGAAISGGLQVLGGGINALFGTKVDQAKLQAANKGTLAYNSFTSNASNFNDIKGPTAQANVQDAYSSGILNSGWAEKRNAELKRQRAEARMFADRSIGNNVSNLVDDQNNDALANFAAFGGFMDIDPSTPIGYSIYTNRFVKDK